MASYVAGHIPVICRYSTTSMGFALRASLWLFKFDPVKFVGSASQHKFIPDEFVFVCPKKSNQKKGHPNQFALRVPSPFAFANGPS